MAQLSDDCFAFGGELLSIEQAAALMVRQVAPIVETESVELAKADRRVLAEDLVAPIPLPPFDNSAVDGYAVHHADLATEGETRLRIGGRIAAGDAAQSAVARGEAVRIFTGAPMPAGADTVYMQEDCRIEGDTVILPAGLKAGSNRRLAGEDVARGTVAVAAGRRLQPADVALAAALGFSRLTVRRPVRVALFSTGNEIVAQGKPLPPAALYDSNRFLLLSLLARAGAETTDLGILKDDRATIAAAIEAAAKKHDLILTSGGVSTGDADHVRAAVEGLGRLVFWRLAIKPGRPVAMGVVGGAAFVGVPGNPVAALVTFINVVRPLIFRLCGAAAEPPTAIPARATFYHRKKKDRREYLRGTLRQSANGPEACKQPVEGAGILSSVTQSTGFIVLPEDVTVISPGDAVQFLPYESVLN
ncbi:MAG TPA: gephyrin-like molybdotransferase Glp [Pseudorhodoplanes sp.]|jgi:molybdopterin molybdotransferase|nr:gephyrin-like molybdotransferase Glp [Pseudorhodoplanes sp.]